MQPNVSAQDDKRIGIVRTVTDSNATLDELLLEAERAHGHLCAGQVLGVRMAMLGLRLLGLPDPRGATEQARAARKRLVTFVEIDRCATDAIAVVTACRLGKRALKFRDWGKMAATFVDLGAGAALKPAQPDFSGSHAVRIAALESSKARAQELYPELEKNAAQMKAYRELPDAELFRTQWVRVPLGPEEMPGFKAGRIACARCGEGISFAREVVSSDGETLCQPCADAEKRYWQPVDIQ
jgi:formylmethanofuran dehydrogenase subunit E